MNFDLIHRQQRRNRQHCGLLAGAADRNAAVRLASQSWHPTQRGPNDHAVLESEAVTSFPFTFWPLPHPHGGAAAGLSSLLQLSSVAMLFQAVMLCAMLYCAVWCCATMRPAVVMNTLCCAVLCCAVLCCAVLCCAVLCCAVLCWAALCWAGLGWAGLGWAGLYITQTLVGRFSFFECQIYVLCAHSQSAAAVA